MLIQPTKVKKSWLVLTWQWLSMRNSRPELSLRGQGDQGSEGKGER